MSRQDYAETPHEEGLSTPSRWKRLQRRPRRPKGPRPARIPGSFYSLAFLLIAIAGFFVSDAVAMQATKRVLPLPEEHDLLNKMGLLVWFVPFLFVGVVSCLSNRKRHLVRWRNTPKPLFAIHMLLITLFGLATGHMAFFYQSVRHQVTPLLEVMGQHQTVTDALPLPGGEGSDLWFEDNGMVKAGQKDAWCARVAMADELLGWTDGSARFSGQGINTFLEGSVLNQAHRQGCLDDAQWLAKKKQSHDAFVDTPGVEQAINQSLSWSPFFRILGKADQLIEEHLILSPSRACVHLAALEETGKPRELFDYCHEALPQERWVTLEELGNLRVEISEWGNSGRGE